MKAKRAALRAAHEQESEARDAAHAEEKHALAAEAEDRERALSERIAALDE